LWFSRAMTSRAPIKICLVGCGRISGKHFAAINALADLTLIGVCDIDKTKAAATAKANGCDAYTDYSAMLKKARPDVVAICTPNAMHPPMTIEAAKAGIHVITEKPMALSLPDAHAMIDACKTAGVHLFVIKQNRYNPPILKLKEALDKGRFGKPIMGSVVVRWTRPQEYYDQDTWHGTLAVDGGMLLNQASHHIDMLRWLMGDVETVSGIAGTLDRDIETEDTSVAVMRFRSGAMGVIEATVCTFPRNLEGSITIQGTHGTVKVGGTAMNKIETWEFKDHENEDDNIKKLGLSPPNVYGFGHNEFYRMALEGILGGENGVNGEEGLKSLELILAIYKSAMQGKPVRLPLDGSETVMTNRFKR
ncbi:MAG: Gfo/Idh/MocA family oxidoreductase, partial [Nanoarchaeota archaeon]